MTSIHLVSRSVSHALRLAAPLAAALLLAPAAPAGAADAPAKDATTKKAPAKPAAKPAASNKKAPVAPKGPVEVVPFAATPEQMDAAQRVYFGVYECEFKQTVDIALNPKYAGYIDVKHLKADYVMKPVLSSTGAVRLEDIKGETLMVQIASKSMLLNVKTGTRIVDDCVSPKQRELIEAARLAKAAEAASPGASDAAPAPLLRR